MKRTGLRTVLLSVGLLAVGFAAGRLWPGQSDGSVGGEGSPQQMDHQDSASLQPPGRKADGGSGSAAAAPLRIESVGAAPRPSPEQDRDVSQLAVADLRQELQQARAELQRLQEEQQAEQGKPLPFPPDLNEAFRGEMLVENLNQAFDSAGVAGDVTAADCSEYPCIVCGDIGRDEGEPKVDEHLKNLRKVAGSESLAPYKEAKKHGSVFAERRDEQGTTVHVTVFCQAFYPDPGDEQVDAAIQQRLRFRVGQLKQGLLPR